MILRLLVAFTRWVWGISPAFAVEDAADWVKEHGGSQFVKPLRCRKSVVVYPPKVKP